MAKEDIAKPVHEDKTGVTIDPAIAFDPRFFLILLLILECLFDDREHRYNPAARPGLWSVDGEGTGAVLAIALCVIDQGVIHIDDFLLKVDVAPPKACHLSHAHTCPEHHREYRAPVHIPGRPVKVVLKQFLLLSSERHFLLYITVMRLFQFHQSFV